MNAVVNVPKFQGFYLNPSSYKNHQRKTPSPPFLVNHGIHLLQHFNALCIGTERESHKNLTKWDHDESFTSVILTENFLIENTVQLFSKLSLL